MEGDSDHVGREKGKEVGMELSDYHCLGWRLQVLLESYLVSCPSAHDFSHSVLYGCIDVVG
jgi:hypothetical protein